MRELAFGGKGAFTDSEMAKLADISGSGGIRKSADGTIIVIKVPETNVADVLASASKVLDSRYAYAVDKTVETFSTPVKGAELMEIDRKEAAIVESSPDTDSTIIVSITDPLLKIDLLSPGAEELGQELNAARRIDLGAGLVFDVLSEITTAPQRNRRVFKIRAADGEEGIFVVSVASTALRGIISIGGDSYALSSIGNGHYVVAKQGRAKLPTTSEPFGAQTRDVTKETGAIPETHNDKKQGPALVDCDRRPEAIAPVKYPVGVFPMGREKVTPRKIKIGLILTDRAIRCLAPPAGREDWGPTEYLEAVIDNLQNEFARDNEEAFSRENDEQHFLDLQYVQTGLTIGDGTDMRRSVSALCRLHPSGAGAALWTQAERMGADVVALVVAHACLLNGFDLVDPCSKSALPRRIPKTCPTIAKNNTNPSKCGYSPSVGGKLPRRGVVVVDAACVSTGVIFHEVGHLLGAQHVPLHRNERGKLRIAHAAIVKEGLQRPTLSLMASTDDCPSGPDACVFLRRWSSANSERKVEMIGANGAVQLLPLGDKNHDNLTVIHSGYDAVASFAQARLSEVCRKLRNDTMMVKFATGEPRKMVTPGAPTPTPDEYTQSAELLELYATSCGQTTFGIRIVGNTDTVGGRVSPVNQDLSKRRAQWIFSQLSQSSSLESHLCDAIGVAGTRPVQSNRTRGGRAANRRVDIRVVVERGQAECRRALHAEPS